MESDLLSRVSRLKGAVGHGPLSARGAVGGRRATAQAGNRGRVLVDGAAGLLRGHAGLGLLVLGGGLAVRVLVRRRSWIGLLGLLGRR
jgi:hypothetical protein